MLVHLNLDIKVVSILYSCYLLLDAFNCCEIYFTTYQRFVANKNVLSPFLGRAEGVTNPLNVVVLVYPPPSLVERWWTQDGKLGITI